MKKKNNSNFTYVWPQILVSTVCEQDRTSQSVEDSGAGCGAESEKKNFYKKHFSTPSIIQYRSQQ
jgi:hypothetical protein